jgi:hypothetical protein
VAGRLARACTIEHRTGKRSSAHSPERQVPDWRDSQNMNDNAQQAGPAHCI